MRAWTFASPGSSCSRAENTSVRSPTSRMGAPRPEGQRVCRASRDLPVLRERYRYGPRMLVLGCSVSAHCSHEDQRIPYALCVRERQLTDARALSPLNSSRESRIANVEPTNTHLATQHPGSRWLTLRGTGAAPNLLHLPETIIVPIDGRYLMDDSWSSQGPAVAYSRFSARLVVSDLCQQRTRAYYSARVPCARSRTGPHRASYWRFNVPTSKLPALNFLHLRASGARCSVPR